MLRLVNFALCLKKHPEIQKGDGELHTKQQRMCTSLLQCLHASLINIDKGLRANFYKDDNSLNVVENFLLNPKFMGCAMLKFQSS